LVGTGIRGLGIDPRIYREILALLRPAIYRTYFRYRQQTGDFPEIGRRVPEAEERDDIRELIFQGYRIIYLIQSKNITIIAVIHGSRNLAGTEDKPW
jgi:mRNA-degrading endonuclease RelE of RelBE toxin-antitoxin system